MSISRSAVTEKADVFAFGILLAEALFVKIPWFGRELHQVTLAVAVEQVTNSEEKNCHISDCHRFEANNEGLEMSPGEKLKTLTSKNI